MHGERVVTPAAAATAGLVEAARQGGEAEAEALIAAVWPRAYRIALSVLGDGMLAEDAAQESCAILFRSIRKLRCAAAFGVWFYRIVVREAAALERKNRALEEPVFPADPHIEQTLLRLDVLQALRALTPAQRTAVALHYYGEMTSPEIGEILGMPDSSVRFHILRAKRQLQQLLKEENTGAA